MSFEGVMMNQGRPEIDGFTLVELVVVIGIMGILAAVAVPRFFDNQPFEERGYYEEVVAALKYARLTAVAVFPTPPF